MVNCTSTMWCGFLPYDLGFLRTRLIYFAGLTASLGVLLALLARLGCCRPNRTLAVTHGGGWEGSHHFSQGENVMNDLGGVWKTLNKKYRYTYPLPKVVGKMIFSQRWDMLVFFRRVPLTNPQNKGRDLMKKACSLSKVALLWKFVGM